MNYKPLSEVANIVMGQSPKGENYNSEGLGLPLLNGPTEFGLHHPEATLFTEVSKRECKSGALIFCVRGSTTGRMNWADQVYSLGRGVCSIDTGNKLENRFIRYCVEHGLEALLKLAGGGTFPNLTKDDIHDFKIPWPQQRRKIAAILSAYDDLIENNTRRVQVLEQMARALYREWFVEYRFPSHEQAEWIEDERGRRPKGWEWVTLGDIAEEVRRSVQPSEVLPDTPYVGLEHIPRRKIALDDWGSVENVKSTKLKFDADDVLFGKIRPYFHKVSVAPMSGICSTDAIVIKALQPEWWPLVVMTTTSDEFVGHSVQTSNGTKMPRANWKVLTQYPVCVPPADILERFNVIVEGIIQQGSTLTQRNATLRQTRDLLLPRLVSGELDVSALDVRGVAEAEADAGGSA